MQLFINGSTVFAFKDSQWGNVLGNLVANRWVDADTAAKLANILLMKIRMLLIDALAMVEMIIINKSPLSGLKNGSYLRLKTLEVGYTLPKSIVNKIKFNNIRVLFVWYQFIDIR